jgi:excisionase family DNA binding protein
VTTSRPNNPVKPDVARTLLTIPQAAGHLGTPERFVRRLIAERRVRFYKVGRYVRFDIRDLDAFVGAGLVEARDRSRR